MGKIVSAEYVTLGHPDRMCDTLASILINKIQQTDFFDSHAAIEVFAVDDTIIFGGEVVTTLKITKKLLQEVVDEGFKVCGYDPSMRKYWSKEEVYLAKDVKILNKIHQQSPDIKKRTEGVESDFNDQGIFYGAYDSRTPTGEGMLKYIAHGLGDYVFSHRDATKYGPDIKVLVTGELEDDGITLKNVNNIDLQVPTVRDATDGGGILTLPMFFDWLEACPIKDKIKFEGIRGGGSDRYVHHGFHADTSMTGRKIVVNTNSAGKYPNRVGGGSMIKPWHASDMLLPLMGNAIAKMIVDMGYTSYATVSSACGFGAKNLSSLCIEDADSKFFSEKNKKFREDLADFFSGDIFDEALGEYRFKWKPSSVAMFLRTFDDGNIFEANLHNFSATELPWCKTKHVSKLTDSFLRFVDKKDALKADTPKESEEKPEAEVTSEE